MDDGLFQFSYLVVHFGKQITEPSKAAKLDCFFTMHVISEIDLKGPSVCKKYKVSTYIMYYVLDCGSHFGPVSVHALSSNGATRILSPSRSPHLLHPHPPPFHISQSPDTYIFHRIHQSHPPNINRINHIMAPRSSSKETDIGTA